MHKIKVVWLPSSLRINSFTLCYEQARSIEEAKRRHKNIFAQVKQFIITNEKYITCFSETRFNSKYLPIDESDITPKTNLINVQQQVSSNGVVFAVVPVLQGKNISVCKYKM